MPADGKLPPDESTGNALRCRSRIRCHGKEIMLISFRGDCHERRFLLMQEKQRISTHRLCMDAMLAALCAVLGYVSLDLGNMKITFESLPILLGALMFGPLDGFAAGAMGTLIYQLLRYGVSVTTLLWILPYALAGLAAGWYAKRRGFVLRGTETLVLVMACELLITLLNTGVMYVDSKIYGYYSFAYIFGSFAMRLVLCLAKGAAFGAVLPRLVRALQALRRRAAV